MFETPDPTRCPSAAGSWSGGNRMTRYFYFWCERCPTRITVETEAPPSALDGEPEYTFAGSEGVGLAQARAVIMKKRSPAAQRAYDETIRTHPKGGGLLGASTRLLCAQFAANEVERAEKKDYNLLALAVACEWCGSRKDEPCRRGPRHVVGAYIKGTHYKRRALAKKLRREATT